MKRLPIPAAVLELVHDDEHAGSLVIWGAAAVGAACFAAAVLAIAFMQ
jgi:hypothetical protein